MRVVERSTSLRRILIVWEGLGGGPIMAKRPELVKSIYSQKVIRTI
jgi:hypothetical protein